MEEFKKYNVLCVDDDSDILPIYKKLFPLLFNEVYFATNGKEGLEIFKKNNNIDLIITDALMPEMDGITMIKEIRKIKKVPVVLISAFNKSESLEDVVFLKKPITTESLINALKEALK